MEAAIIVFSGSGEVLFEWREMLFLLLLLLLF